MEEALDESSDSDEDEMDTSITKPGSQACSGFTNITIVLCYFMIKSWDSFMYSLALYDRVEAAFKDYSYIFPGREGTLGCLLH